MLARVEECGSTYLPQVNAFYVREFQMMHAAEDVTRFLHQACQGLPHRLNGHPTESEFSIGERAVDRFYVRVMEHAIADFGSRVLYPSRSAQAAESVPLKRSAVDRIAQAAAQDEANLESTALDVGRRIGGQVYDAYLSGKLEPRGLRRLFLAHLEEPGMARKVCGAVLSKLKAVSRSMARAAQV